jgi:hypothetical protein
LEPVNAPQTLNPFLRIIRFVAVTWASVSGAKPS